MSTICKHCGNVEQKTLPSEFFKGDTESMIMKANCYPPYPYEPLFGVPIPQEHAHK